MRLQKGDTFVMDLPERTNAFLRVVSIRVFPATPAPEPFIDATLIPPDGWLWSFPTHQFVREGRYVCLLAERSQP